MLNKPDSDLGAKIEKAALLGLRRSVPRIPTEPFFCLKFVRRCVEYAIGLRDRGFYSLVTGVDSNPTAQELETLLRTQRPRWVVQNALPGDLVFWAFSSGGVPYGHVGIVVRRSRTDEQLWVAQNTIANTGIRFQGALAMLKLEDMGTPRTIIRIGA